MRRVEEAIALLIIVASFWLVLAYGVPLQMEVNDIRNQQRWESQR
jgi:hypothetical protein